MARRLISAVVLIPLVLAILWFNPFGVAVFILLCLLSAGMILEYRGLVNRSGASVGVGDTLLMWAACVLWVAPSGVGGVVPSLYAMRGVQGAVLVVLVVGSFVFALWPRRADSATLHAASVVLGGVLIGWCFAYHSMRLYTDMGAAGLFVVLGSVWVCDTVAYGVGKSLGTHPIVPTISPNKTWEGTIAGFVGAVAAGTALTPWLTGGTIWIGVGAGALVGVFAQLSDLVESALKRDAGVKDAGGLIPGHGGLLDRVDSLILTAPVLYYYLGLVGR